MFAGQHMCQSELAALVGGDEEEKLVYRGRARVEHQCVVCHLVY